jgi:hydroxymethylglutaryl-CoA lyase
MQGLQTFIPTEEKINYLNQLLKVGFDVLDFGSFVSPKAIPQLRDTAEVLASLEPSETSLLAIVANRRGAEQACSFDSVRMIGYPFSISETFQIRNTNTKLEDAFELVSDLVPLINDSGKKLRIYLSMGFGNPYGDEYNENILSHWLERLAEIGVEEFYFSDTIGVAELESIEWIGNSIIPKYPQLALGMHLHTNPLSARSKIEAAFNSGCTRFDSAMLGFGGCPMAKDELVGNMATETIYNFISSKQIETRINRNEFEKANILAQSLFSRYSH